MSGRLARSLVWRKAQHLHFIVAFDAMSESCHSDFISTPDLNLLITLNVLLTEGSVARAAQRLRLSPSAMSRSLARLREVTGDPLLVRAGRGLVPTPRALELRERVSQLVQDAEAVLRPVEEPDLLQLHRTFTMRCRDGFVENFGPDLIARINAEAPNVRLRFVQKLNKDSTPLRDGSVHLETAVVDEQTSLELRTQALFRDRFIGVVRLGHPLGGQEITAEQYASAKHISVARRGYDHGQIDESLDPLGLERQVVTMVSGFATALALAQSTDLVATVPERHTGKLRLGMHSFALPFVSPEFTVSMLWHPRLHADPAHRWFRSCVREVCLAQFQGNRVEDWQAVSDV